MSEEKPAAPTSAAQTVETPAPNEDERAGHIRQILDHVRPYLQAEGGDVELVGIQDDVVTIRMTGACAGCALVTIDLDQGIKNWIMEEIPSIKDVVLDTSNLTADYGNPYGWL